MDEEKVRYFIEAERKKGTSTEELIFIYMTMGCRFMKYPIF